jgi:hypothetical protein
VRLIKPNSLMCHEVFACAKYLQGLMGDYFGLHRSAVKLHNPNEYQ